jgi:O-antigen/teichoic acid export membrane protein
LTSLKRNIIANYLGQGWAAVMGLAFVPVYIRYLGMESYGLVGLFAVMQAWLTLLDMGMTPTLNREMARFTAGAHTPQSIGDLLRSLEIVCFSIAAIIGAGLWAASGYLAGHWLKVEKLPNEVVVQALGVMALVVSLRFVEGIYRGSLYGLQRQIWYNSVAAVLATIRYGGAIAILAWVSPTIQAFFFWQAFVSLLSVSVLAVSVHRALPSAPAPPAVSRRALAGVWKFAGGMMGITFLAILLTQVDKILLSRLLTLERFGYYTLAAAVAGVLYIVIGPIAQAIYPRMVELASRDDEATMISVYHQAAQLVTVVTAPAVMLLSFFASGVIYLWSGNPELAQNTAPILSALVVGTFLNGLMVIPYQFQLAHGWTDLTLKVNLVAVTVLIPAIFWVVPRYGAVGAARIWVVLNAGYVLFDIQLMHRKLIPREKWRWYFADVLLPMAGAMGVVLVAQKLQPVNDKNRLHWLAFLLLTGVSATLISSFLASTVRARLKSYAPVRHAGTVGRVH